MRKKYTIGSSLSEVSTLINSISEDIGLYLKGQLLKECVLGVYELVVNAIEHGNLAVTYEMKKTWLRDNIYEQRLEEMSENTQDKKVYIDISVEDKILMIKVTDEGNGFDIEEQLNRQIKDNILRENGRGIIIVQHFFDKVLYNKKGNEVVVSKYLPEHNY